MQTFILRRLLIGVVILFFLSVAVFVLVRMIPGDPAQQRCGLNCTPEQIAAIEAQMGLDVPLPQQYWDWISGILTGDLGTSTLTQRPVSEALKNRLPVTLELVALTMFLTIVIGIPFGIISAIFRDSPLDFSVRLIAIFGLAVPSFWVATLVLIVPLNQWGYAPPIGRYVEFTDDPWGNLKQMGPPAAVLALASAAGIMRLTRSSLLEVLRQDFMRTARAKGLAESSIVVSHGLKNSMIPVVTVLGLQMGGLLGGALIIEQIFTLPGLGQYTFQALFNKDYEVIQTMTLYAGVAVVLLNLAVDVSYAWLDPRIRYS